MLRTLIALVAKRGAFTLLEKSALVWLALVFGGVLVAVFVVSFPLVGLAKLADVLRGT